MAVEPGTVRKPNARILINDKPLPALLRVEVDNNNFYAADEWRAVLALSAQESWDYWASTPGMVVEIQIGEAGAEETVIVGEADRVITDPVQNLLLLNGRDMSASLIDNRTRNKFLNWRTHKVVETLAKRHGLSAVVAETPMKAGTFFNNDVSEIDLGPSHWDLLTFLAQNTGRALYVRGRTLYFVDEGSLERKPYPLPWSGRPARGGNPKAPVMRMELERNLVLAQDVVVNVLSYNAETGEEVSATAQSSARVPIVDHRGRRRFKQVYTREIPDLTPAAADERALKLLEEITRHERRLRFVAPGDNELTTESLIRLSGTGTSYDQDYYPDHILRTWSWDQGYVMRVRAKNHSPVSTVSGQGLPSIPAPTGPAPE